MASRNAYMAAAVRIEGHEIKWGDPTCLCEGRGWHFVGEDDETIDVASCPMCSPCESEEDEDRLNERLFLVAAVAELFHRANEGQGPTAPEEDLDLN